MGAVIAFIGLTVAIYHCLMRLCFSKKGHNENEWVLTTALKKERGNIVFSILLLISALWRHLFIIVYLFQLQLASTEWWCWLWWYRWGKQILLSGYAFCSSQVLMDIQIIYSVLLWTKEHQTALELHTNFPTCIFHRATFATSLHSLFDTW